VLVDVAATDAKTIGDLGDRDEVPVRACARGGVRCVRALMRTSCTRCRTTTLPAFRIEDGQIETIPLTQ
jgi:hypothetical protein